MDLIRKSAVPHDLRQAAVDSPPRRIARILGVKITPHEKTLFFKSS
jgi:hypothetical protein